MIEFEYTIKDPVGLHMRPACELLKIVGSMDSDVFIVTEDKVIKVDSTLKLITAGIVSGTRVLVRVIDGNYTHNADVLKKKIAEFL